MDAYVNGTARSPVVVETYVYCSEVLHRTSGHHHQDAGICFKDRTRELDQIPEHLSVEALSNHMMHDASVT